MTIQKRTKAARVAAGLTQAELADKAGVSQNAISKIENGTTRKPKDIVAIAKALNVSVEYLSDGDSDFQINESEGTYGSHKANQLIKKIKSLSVRGTLPDSVCVAISTILDSGFAPLTNDKDKDTTDKINQKLEQKINK
ncbi:helix-turn-helix domain-containing protein [Glaciecola siphonariae]|uniref:Helix-turn-helix domain-containing protein n=1 Tax=Glaciecola siphonariae TaxID=521012 RepID=A0ABV9LTM9_9ALTE